MKTKKVNKNLVPYIILAIFMAVVLYLVIIGSYTINELTYDEFITSAEAGELTDVYITPRDGAGIYELSGTMEGYEDNESFEVSIPKSDESITLIYTLQEEQGFKLTAEDDPSSSTLLIFLVNVLPFLLLIGLAFFVISRQLGGANKSMDFGKSKAKLNPDNNKLNFDNVAGLTEEKEEVKELIDFLRAPKKFQKMGARIPKGILLVGPPGTGKTLLAKAVAGEAKVPFYFISGSDFVELFVGVGASRVRDMFKQAKHNAPCLIFIDEIDAVGRQRGAGVGGGNDEREQTLNQLLTEMDGFGANEGIIIIAATNRPDVLDPALLRPGRFDRQITVSLPDVREREEILNVHAKGKTFGEDVALKNIAKRTVGMSGADLENLLNESALLAVREGKSEINMADVDEAHDRVLMGPAKKSRKYGEEEKKLVAYHEAGHVVLGLKLDAANDVQKVTIIPRSNAGGYAMMTPKEDRLTATKTELLERVIGLLGGRVSEEIMFKDITTGAHNDFEKATKIVRSMVTEYGMSDLGPMQLEHRTGSVFLGRDYNNAKNFSDKVAHEIDTEMRKIMDSCYKKATEIITKNKKLLTLIAESLLEYETLTKEQIDSLYKEGKMPESKEEDLNKLSLAELKKLAKEKGIKGFSLKNKEELIKELKK